MAPFQWVLWRCVLAALCCSAWASRQPQALRTARKNGEEGLGAMQHGWQIYLDADAANTVHDRRLFCANTRHQTHVSSLMPAAICAQAIQRASFHELYSSRPKGTRESGSVMHSHSWISQQLPTAIDFQQCTVSWQQSMNLLCCFVNRFNLLQQGDHPCGRCLLWTVLQNKTWV